MLLAEPGRTATRLAAILGRPVDEFDEHVLEAGVVVVGVLPDERDHLPIAVGGLSVLTTGLVHHAEAVVAVVDRPSRLKVIDHDGQTRP